MNDIFGSGGAIPRSQWLGRLLISACVAMAFVGVVLSISVLRMQVHMNESLSALRIDQQAQGVVQAYYARDRYKGHELLCQGEGKDTGLCRMVSIKSFDYTSSTNDLWVMLDAVTVLADATNLPVDKRRMLTRAYADLVLAVNDHGALDSVLTGDAFPDMLAANDLYAATMAQAMVCRALIADMPCVNGLPHDVSAALRRLATFVEMEGPAIDPYNTNQRLEGVRAVLASL